MSDQAVKTISPQERERYKKLTMRKFWIALVISVLLVFSAAIMIVNYFYYKDRISMGGGDIIGLLLLNAMIGIPVVSGICFSMGSSAKNVSRDFLKLTHKLQLLIMLLAIVPLIVFIIIALI